MFGFGKRHRNTERTLTDKIAGTFVTMAAILGPAISIFNLNGNELAKQAQNNKSAELPKTSQLNTVSATQETLNFAPAPVTDYGLGDTAAFLTATHSAKQDTGNSLTAFGGLINKHSENAQDYATDVSKEAQDVKFFEHTDEQTIQAFSEMVAANSSVRS